MIWTNGITDLTALKNQICRAKKYSIEKEMNNYDLAMQFPDEDTDIEMLSARK